MSDSRPSPTPSAHIGLSTIGNLTLAAASRAGFQPIAGVDRDPSVIGQDLGSLAGLAPSGVLVASELSAESAPAIAFVSTASSLEVAAETILPLVDRGIHVVSTCEELAFPWTSNRALSERIDEAARRAGVAVVGTGVNPGFVMDTLPLALAGATGSIESVVIDRHVDVSSRRIQLQRKVGAGLTVEEFKREADAGRLGHVGLRESAQMVAAGLGLSSRAVEMVMEPVVADRRVILGETVIEPGQCTGMRQRAVVRDDDTAGVTLNLTMAVGVEQPHDAIHIAGIPSLTLTIPEGIAGDTATAAVCVTAARAIPYANPGLRTMPELAIRPWLGSIARA